MKTNVSDIIESACSKRNIFGVSFAIANENGSYLESHQCGDYKTNNRYYIASVNKIIISALILQKIYNGYLQFDEPLHPYLPTSLKNGLHRIKGKDYTKSITIQHLLSHTSGLPCYLVDKGLDGISWMKDLEKEKDHIATPELSLQRASQIEAKFPPGQEKAYYSDTNYQALCFVLEECFQKPVSILLNDLFQELNMKNTAVISDSNYNNFIIPYNKDFQCSLPLFFSSTGNDVYSTPEDQILFLRAFFTGYFFSTEFLEKLKVWKPIFFPFKYGIGLEQFSIPKWISWIFPNPEMLGQIGSTGSIAFFCPEKKCFIAGTVNQQSSPQLAVQTAIKIVNSFRT